MNGCQLAGFTACAANTMNSTTTASLMKTMTLLVVADSLMPMTSSVVTRAMMITAVTLVPSAHLTTVPRAADSAHGTSSPMSCRNDTTYPDQPMATVTAPRAYSRTRSHPMIHAKISPSVA